MKTEESFLFSSRFNFDLVLLVSFPYLIVPSFVSNSTTSAVQFQLLLISLILLLFVYYSIVALVSGVSLDTCSVSTF